MADVMEPAESLERRRDRREKPTSSDELPPPPPPPPPPLLRRRDRDSRERRDERDDRPPNRRGEYHDRRSPPPRDRDYKRRLSPSPPPYRDRRHSPSRRSSPPPPSFKRSRREDGGYDNRRGSPRGGFDERRLGYDYGGGFDRGGMAGKPGFADDRHHGRYMGRSSDWSDPARGGYGDGPNMGPTQREGLMSYKQFIQELEDDILPAEAERRYQEYKSEYISTQKHTFFEAHKEEEWLKDKYHPTNLLTVIERRNEHARSSAKDFLLDLQSGTLDLGPSFISPLSVKSGQGSDPNSEDEVDTSGKRRRHGRGPTKENDLMAAAAKAHPVSSEPRRIQVDVEQAQVLVRKLDKEKGIEENVLASDPDKSDGDKAHSGSMGPIIIIRGLTTVRGLEGVELLDTLLTYLWRIHGLDYYGMSETNEPKGLRHVRADHKSPDEARTGAADWEKKLDLHWQARLEGQDPLEKMAAKEKIDAAAVEGLDPYVRKIRDEKYGWKYGCGAKGCTKLFHAVEFVHKHLRLKHPELTLELTSKVREDLYFENYMNDPDAPGGTPIMQQALARRRFPDSRLGSNRRDQNDRVNGDERYERNENSPSRDFQSNKNGGTLEGGNPDDPMFDSFGGQNGMHCGPPFSSDMPPPPPILMPVPGAGPLGPFVPAPPEVAMRMMREQGGPPSYDGNGAPRGRKGGRPVPSVGGPAAILPMGPAFRQDPRGIRSYQDLDAPDEEVTVIDYRSL